MIIHNLGEQPGRACESGEGARESGEGARESVGHSLRSLARIDQFNQSRPRPKLRPTAGSDLTYSQARA